MQNITTKVRENFQDLEKFLKLKFSKKKSVPQHILFQDFFRCERTAKLLGISFLKGNWTVPNKWIKANSVAFLIGTILFLIFEVISCCLSIQKNMIGIMIENILFCGCYCIVGVKTYIVFKHNRAKIDEIIEKLDEHFPHYGVDQLTFKAQNYLDILKRFEIVDYINYAFIGMQVCFMPFLHQIYGAVKSVSIEWETLFALTLPFDQLQPVVYELIWILESWLVFYSVLYFMCADLLFFSLMQILIMEFDILSQVISEIDMIKGEEAAIKELKKLIDIHEQLIEVSEKLNEVFSFLQLINVFGSIVALCTASFLVAVNYILMLISNLFFKRF